MKRCEKTAYNSLVMWKVNFEFKKPKFNGYRFVKDPKTLPYKNE